MLNALESFVAAKQYEVAAHHLMNLNLSRFAETSPDCRPIFPGELAAIATNHSFSLELFLKSLLLINTPELANGKKKLGHEFDGLYEKLPQAIQTRFSSEFSSELESKPHLWIQSGHETKAFPDIVKLSYNIDSEGLGISSHQRLATITPIWSQDSSEVSLPIVLKENAKTFVQFRYSWENWLNQNPIDLKFDFLNIHVAIQILKKGIAHHTPLGRYVMTFKAGERESNFSISE